MKTTLIGTIVITLCLVATWLLKADFYAMMLTLIFYNTLHIRLDEKGGKQ